MGDTVRVLGQEATVTIVPGKVAWLINDATPVLSDAIDTSSYPRKRILVFMITRETGATTHTVTLSVTESATSGGVYTASTASAVPTPLDADGVQYFTVKRNPLKPWLKLTVTGSHADVDQTITNGILFF